MKRLLLAALFALGFAAPALVVPAAAQTIVNSACSPSATYPIGARGLPYGIDANGAVCINGSITASLSGFAPATTGTPISVTTSGVTGTLPAGAVVVATNVGTTNGAYCKLGASSTTSDQYIAPNGGWFAYTVGASTQLTCITSTSTTTVNMVGGSGLPTGTGGGGGSGGGGAITAASGAFASGSISSGAIASGAIASGAVASGALAAGSGTDGWDVSTGITTAAAATVGSTGSVSSKLRLMTTQLDAIQTAVGAAIPTCGANPCTNAIGVVDQRSAYPAGAVPYTASATGTTGATTATLTGASSVTTYICGFSIRANATAAATGNATVTGTITGTLNFTQWTAPNASGLGITEMIFAPCVPASATNTSVAVVSAAPGTGGVVSVTSWGYKL